MWRNFMGTKLLDELDKEIYDNELLYRANLVAYKDTFKNGRALPGLFVDNRGCSVFRDYKRTEQEAMADCFNSVNGDIDAIVKIDASKCRSFDTYPIPKRTKLHDYHAEIHDSITVIPISSLKAIKLAQNCRIAFKK